MALNARILLVLAGALLPAAEAPRGGINRADLDPTCKPCVDFWRYANGGWLDKNPIPARYPSWGTMSVLAESNREKLRGLLEAAAADTAAGAASNEHKLGNFYASCMNTDAIEARFAKPIATDLEKIAAIGSVRELESVVAELQRNGLIGPFTLTSAPDAKNSSEVIAQIAPTAISLPDRDYYFRADIRSEEIRKQFTRHIATMLELLGDHTAAATAEAQTVLAFETTLAESLLTNVERRDPYARYHRMDLAGLAALTPAFDWKLVLAQFQLPESTPLNVTEPKFLKKLNQQLTTAPIETWRTWLRWRVVNAAAPALAKPFFDEHFRFHSTVLQGVTEQQPRWQTCTATIDRSMGDALGELFVRRYFPPEAKRRMNELVDNLRATLREELGRAAWLRADTRKNAEAKLSSFVPKIGYPDKWRDYSALTMDRATYFENVRAATLHNRSYQVAKIGKPVNRNDWGMTPPTVNAYYNASLNEIVFPAGILQPPMFNLAADDAINYGAIGAVIGHEMGHGFDDQGSKYDAAGNLKNWWTPEDRKQFDERAACVTDQFNTLEVGDGLHHNGRLVLGEALGDLSGLTLAYRAYQRSLRGKEPPPVLDGFTADQRFFLAFARVWGSQMRPEAVRLQLNTNPHPLARFRAIGTLQNMPEFHKAFQCQVGDPMVRPPAKQCKLW